MLEKFLRHKTLLMKLMPNMFLLNQLKLKRFNLTLKVCIMYLEMVIIMVTSIKKEREKAKELAHGSMDQHTLVNGRMANATEKVSLLFKMAQDTMVCGSKIESKVKVNFTYPQKKS